MKVSKGHIFDNGFTVRFSLRSGGGEKPFYLRRSQFRRWQGETDGDNKWAAFALRLPAYLLARKELENRPASTSPGRSSRAIAQTDPPLGRAGEPQVAARFFRHCSATPRLGVRARLHRSLRGPAGAFRRSLDGNTANWPRTTKAPTSAGAAHRRIAIRRRPNRQRAARNRHGARHLRTARATRFRASGKSDEFAGLARFRGHAMPLPAHSQSFCIADFTRFLGGERIH